MPRFGQPQPTSTTSTVIPEKMQRAIRKCGASATKNERGGKVGLCIRLLERGQQALGTDSCMPSSLIDTSPCSCSSCA